MASSELAALDPSVLEALHGRVGHVLEGAPEGRGRRVAIVCARFNGAITARLLAGALDALAGAGVEAGDVSVAWAPGAFELPLVARALATGERRVDAVVALGAVVRGETGHYEFVAGECARGLQDVALATGVPVAFGVLTTETLDQALERSGDDAANKGREAALTALETVAVVRGAASR
jgi:6,7-dimethyl-8-ribityllumazine synthase